MNCVRQYILCVYWTYWLFCIRSISCFHRQPDILKSRDAICIQKDNYSLDLVFTKSNYTAVEKKFRQWQMAADGIDAYNDEEVEGGHEQMYVWTNKP